MNKIFQNKKIQYQIFKRLINQNYKLQIKMKLI